MRYTNLQAGRTIATIAVLIAHAVSIGFSKGRIPLLWNLDLTGVHFRVTVIFFFALSGYVLAHWLQTVTLAKYIRARFQRLFLGFWLAVGVVLTVRFLDGQSLHLLQSRFLVTMSLVPSGPNFASHVLHVEWTLIYEWFLSMAVIPLAALGRRRGLGIGAALWLCVILLVNAKSGPAQLVMIPRLSEAFVSMVNVPFLLGILVYLSQSTLIRSKWMLLSGAVLSYFAGGALAHTSSIWSYAVQSMSMAMLIVILSTGPQLSERNWLVRWGDWTYGVYLLHCPILILFFSWTAACSWLKPSFELLVLVTTVTFLLSSLFGMVEMTVYRRTVAIPLFPRLVASSRPLVPFPGFFRIPFFKVRSRT